MRRASSYAQGTGMQNNLLAKGYEANSGKSEYTRSIYFFGSPYDTEEDVDENQAKVLEFQETVADHLAEKFGLKATWYATRRPLNECVLAFALGAVGGTSAQCSVAGTGSN